MRPRQICTIFAALAGAFTIFSNATAATLHHWTFEPSPGFLSDSVGSSTFTGSATGTTLALSAPGGLFRGLPGNSSAADLTTGGLLTTIPDAPAGVFTIELFAHANSAATGFGAILAGVAAGNANTSVAWALQDRGGNIALTACSGASCDVLSSGVPLTPGLDFYVAAGFDPVGGKVRFFIRDLGSGNPLQVVDVTHGFTGLNAITAFQTGATFAFDGLVDEIRLSDTLLAESELLIEDWAAPVPLPPALWLMSSLLAPLAFRSRKFG